MITLSAYILGLCTIPMLYILHRTFKVLYNSYTFYRSKLKLTRIESLVRTFKDY